MALGQVYGGEAMAWPATAAALVQQIARFLLLLAPYLDLLEETGFSARP